MTMNLLQMANHLDASTNRETLNYVLLGKPHHEKGPNHPTYMEMIKGAIQAINYGNGSSKTAILKYIAQNYHVGENLPKVNSHLRVVLKKAVDNGDLEQTRGHGASGSFKMRQPNEKFLQVGIPMIPPNPIAMLKELTKLDFSTTPNTNSKKTSASKSKAIPKKKDMGKKTTTKLMGKKRILNLNTIPRDGKNSKTIKQAGAKPTFKMSLRQGTRKSYK